MKYYRNTLSVLLLILGTGAAHATENADSVVYQDHSVGGIVYIQEPSKLILKDVIVNPSGSLNARSQDYIELKGEFEVLEGGQLELDCGQMYRIRYTYDAAGNTESRKRGY